MRMKQECEWLEKIKQQQQHKKYVNLSKPITVIQKQTADHYMHLK